MRIALIILVFVLATLGPRAALRLFATLHKPSASWPLPLESGQDDD